MRAGVAIACSALVAVSCVTVYEDAPLIDVKLAPPEFAVAQTIPFGTADRTPEERLLGQIYDGVLRDMQQAVNDSDPEALRALLLAYDKPNLPPVYAERIAGFHLLEKGLRFAGHVAQKATLTIAAAPGDAANAPVPVPPIGGEVHLELAVPAYAEAVHLGGQDEQDPVGFAIAIDIQDWYADGSARSERRHDVDWLPSGFDLAGEAVLRQPFALQIDGGRAVRRTVSMTVELMAPYVGIGGERVPLTRRRTIAAVRFVQWPAGYEPIAARPLDTLREALRIGDDAHLPHVFLGAAFTTGAEREQALALLIDQVRLGRLQLAQVAMATLRDLCGVEIAIGDREGWLAWWAMRR